MTLLLFSHIRFFIQPVIPNTWLEISEERKEKRKQERKPHAFYHLDGDGSARYVIAMLFDKDKNEKMNTVERHFTMGMNKN